MFFPSEYIIYKISFEYISTTIVVRLDETARTLIMQTLAKEFQNKLTYHLYAKADSECSFHPVPHASYHIKPAVTDPYEGMGTWIIVTSTGSDAGTIETSWDPDHPENAYVQCDGVRIYVAIDESEVASPLTQIYIRTGPVTYLVDIPSDSRTEVSIEHGDTLSDEEKAAVDANLQVNDAHGIEMYDVEVDGTTYPVAWYDRYSQTYHLTAVPTDNPLYVAEEIHMLGELSNDKGLIFYNTTYGALWLERNGTLTEQFVSQFVDMNGSDQSDPFVKQCRSLSRLN